MKAILTLALLASTCSAQTVADVRRGFEKPPDDARIMMRWWWFGPAVTKPELERELKVMKDGGIGGVEVQPVYPVALDDPEIGFKNLPYMSEEFLDALGFAAAKARELGLRMDLTLGSGWPFGGPHVPASEAACRLRVDRVPVSANTTSLPMPDLEHGEKLIAAFLARGDGKSFTQEGTRPITPNAMGRVALPRDLSGPHVVVFFIESRTGQQVKRAAVDSEGFVLDHLSRPALDRHLRVVGERLLKAFGPNPPYAIFSDSLEVYGSDWTPGFLQEFRKRRGYDLTPLLPALVGDFGERTGQVRHDWGQTLTELVDEKYLIPLRDWAKARGTRVRSQTYGIPPVALSSNNLVDLPEGEGTQWRAFSTARWAASAGHLYGKKVTSSETWTWLHSPSFRATPLDMKAEADLHFIQGVNQLIGHGWPYSPPVAGEPGWRFYASAVFNEHNPWWIVMSEISLYMQRVSYLLRQGQPANDVALYLPTDDVWTTFSVGGRDSINQTLAATLPADLIPKILDAGFNFDYIDDRAIAELGIKYPVVVLPPYKKMPPATAQQLEEFKKRGGIVVEAGQLDQLAKLHTPDFATGNPAIGFIHRKLSDGDLYFVTNTSNQPVEVTPQVRAKGSGVAWDAMTGKTVGPASGWLRLAPYESRVLVYGSTASLNVQAPKTPSSIDVSGDWKVTFPALQRSVDMPRLRSWSEDEDTRYYSGTAVYVKKVSIAAELAEGTEVVLDFGPGTPVAPTRRTNGMRAWLDGPVRDSAVVFVNGKRAGGVWHPPYEIAITNLLRSGENEIRIEVANTAINRLSGQKLPTYRLLKVRYGDRFQPQDMDNLQPLPSGILGPVRIVSR